MLGLISTAEQEEIERYYFQAVKPAPREPTFYAMAGCPGAGKSTLRKRLLDEHKIPRHSYIHDPDHIMLSLSGYLEDVARFTDTKGLEEIFKKWEMPARTIADELVEKALQLNADIIYDRSCALPESLSFLEKIRKKNYNIVMHSITITLGNACQRIMSRAEERHVAQSTIKERMEKLNTFWESYSDICNELYLYDNNSAQFPFELIMHKKGGVIDIFNPQKFNGFLEQISTI